MKSRRRKKERKKKKKPKNHTYKKYIYINLKKCGKKEKEKVCKQLPVFPGGHPSKY